jgi:hypothetical protein
MNISIKPLMLKNGREQGEINFGCSFYSVIEQQQAIEEGLDPFATSKCNVFILY